MLFIDLPSSAYLFSTLHSAEWCAYCVMTWNIQVLSYKYFKSFQTFEKLKDAWDHGRKLMWKRRSKILKNWRASGEYFTDVMEDVEVEARWKDPKGVKCKEFWGPILARMVPDLGSSASLLSKLWWKQEEEILGKPSVTNFGAQFSPEWTRIWGLQWVLMETRWRDSRGTKWDEFWGFNFCQNGLGFGVFSEFCWKPDEEILGEPSETNFGALFFPELTRIWGIQFQVSSDYIRKVLLAAASDSQVDWSFLH